MQEKSSYVYQVSKSAGRQKAKEERMGCLLKKNRQRPILRRIIDPKNRMSGAKRGIHGPELRYPRYGVRKRCGDESVLFLHHMLCKLF